MAYIDTTGVVKQISDDSSIVCVTIGDVPRLFTFSKYLLYVGGLQCEGRMRNILEQEMDVSVRYSFNQAENIFTLVAVWLWEMPDCLSNDCQKLRAYYDQKGHVVSVADDGVLVQDDNQDYTILISEEVIFRDGSKIIDGIPLGVGQAISFDMIPFECPHPTGALYQATCAWVGEKLPTLTDRFALHSPVSLEDPWDSPNNLSDIVHGVVVVVPNEVVAFVETDLADENHVKVLVFRKSFQSGCTTIKDVACVGDRLCMRISSKMLFQGCKQWYAVKAWRDGGMVGVDKQLERGDVLDSRDEEAMPQNKGQAGEQRVSSNESAAQVAGKASVAVHPDKSEPLKSLSGDFDDIVFSVISTNTASLLHGDKKVHVHRKCVVYEGKPCPRNVFVLFTAPGFRVTGYEATSMKDARLLSEGYMYEATKVKIESVSSNLSKSSESAAVPEIRETSSVENSASLEPEVSKRDRLSLTTEVKFTKSSKVLLGDPPLTGFIVGTTPDDVYLSFNDLKIHFSFGNVYFKSSCADKDPASFIHKAKSVPFNFEAVKTFRSDLILAGFSHEATCVWASMPKPSLLYVANTLPAVDLSLASDKQQIFTGTVRKFCLPKIALVVIDGNISTVSLHVSAFGTKPKSVSREIDYINSYVSLDDKIEFKVDRIPAIPKVLSAVNVKVIGRGINQYTPKQTGGSVKNLYTFVPLFSKTEKTWFVNCSGFVRIEGNKVSMESNGHSISIIDATTNFLSIGNNWYNVDCFSKFKDQFVRFEATTKDGKSFDWKKVCLSTDDRAPERYLASELLMFVKKQASDLKLGEILSGKIIQIPFHDCAIAFADRISLPVLIKFSSLVTEDEINPSCSCMDTYMKQGDRVLMEIVERECDLAEGKGRYYFAKRCWKSEVGGSKRDVVPNGTPKRLTWMRKWVFGEIGRKEVLCRINGRYMVSFKASKVPGLKLTLEIPKDNFLMDGKLTDPPGNLEGREITFHAAHEDDPESSMYITCAWIGKEPSAADVLAGRIAVPKCCIENNWYYGGTVGYWTCLPQYAVCYTGAAPVLLKANPKDSFDPGDQIRMRVNERQLLIGNKCYLECSDAAKMKTDLENVVLSIPGKVGHAPQLAAVNNIEPKAVGELINVVGLKNIPNVSFELVHVRVPNDVETARKDYSKWFQTISEILHDPRSSTIHFSAVLLDRKVKRWRAMEVLLKPSEHHCAMLRKLGWKINNSA